MLEPSAGLPVRESQAPAYAWSPLHSASQKPHFNASIMSSPCGWRDEEQRKGKIMWVVSKREKPTETSQGNGIHQLQAGLATQQDWNILNSNVVGRKKPECPAVTSLKEGDYNLLWRVSFSYLPCGSFLLLLLKKMWFISYVICMCNWRELSHWSS